MVKVIEALQEDFEEQKMMIEQLLDMLITQQARIGALCEILIKEQLTDPQELSILEEDNKNIIQYSLMKN